MTEKFNITILVSPLDWGLGHATRCIPLVKHLLLLGCKVIIACDATQEKLLKKELPSITYTYLAGYGITYTTSKWLFSLKILLQLPKVVSAINNEQKWLKKFLKENDVHAIISDNRYGLYCSAIPSIFITHQLRIKAPFQFAESIMQKLNYRLIQKFSTCWVPDERDNINLAGRLSHPQRLPKVNVEYIGGISRFQKKTAQKTIYNLAVLISGPEPQRSVFEKKILKELAAHDGKAILVRGLPAAETNIAGNPNLDVLNHLPASDLEAVLDKSEFIISRSGYTTVMDLIKLGKKSILVPTPGQTEQEYLAKHLQNQKWCVAAEQEDFSLLALLKKAKEFDYQLPDLKMESYKEVLTRFVQQVMENNSHQEKG